MTPLKILVLVLTVVLFFTVIMAVYFFVRMIFEIDSKKKILANLLPWAVPFLPGLLTDKGRYYHSRFTTFFLASVLMAGFVITVDYFYDQQKNIEASVLNNDSRDNSPKKKQIKY